MASRTARRRQRSTRLTVAVSLVMISALLVAGAVIGQSAVLLTISAAVAVALGAAATKITHSELVQTRVEWARDRAQQAHDYRVLADRTSAENTELRDTLTARIAERQQLIHELEGELALAHTNLAATKARLGAEARRAEQAEGRLVAEGARLEEAEQRAAEAIVLAAELEQEIADLRAELVAWEAAATPAARVTA